MPARMWRHGIHSFLELLRHRLPESLDHMLAFVYFAYSMMALLMESVPSFVETWIESLSDRAQHRTAIEEIDMHDSEIWSGCTKMWYKKAADKSPTVGRIQYHLAALARPNIVEQLFYYSKAILSWLPFPDAKESVLLHFNPFLQEPGTVGQKHPTVEAAFIMFHQVLFVHGHWDLCQINMDPFLSDLDIHVGRIGSKFRTQGSEIASPLFHLALGFGNTDSAVTKAFQPDTERGTALEAVSKDVDQSISRVDDFQAKIGNLRRCWKSAKGEPGRHAGTELQSEDLVTDPYIANIEEAPAQAAKIITQRNGDKNIVPYMHIQLAFLWNLVHVPEALQYIQRHIPWDGVVNFLNTLGRSAVDETCVVGDEFPRQLSGTGGQLPEDFPMRGLVWTPHYFSSSFFQSQVMDEDERTLGFPSHAAPRAQRYLWLGVSLASVS